MSKVIEDMLNEAVKESMTEAALRMLEDGILTPEKISGYVDLPLEDVKKLKVDKFVSLWKRPLWILIFNKFYCKLMSFIMKDKIKFNQLRFRHHYDVFLNNMKTGDVLFFPTGGTGVAIDWFSLH